MQPFRNSGRSVDAMNRYDVSLRPVDHRRQWWGRSVSMLGRAITQWRRAANDPRNGPVTDARRLSQSRHNPTTTTSFQFHIPL